VAAYATLSKPAWTLGLSILCFLLFHGEGGVIKDFLELPVFTKLAR
jgi:hypothetical protein